MEFTDKEIKNIQLEYFKNQVNFGRKTHCNLLPKSYDFYKLCPTKIDDKNITINYEDLNIPPEVINCDFEKNLKVPIDLIPKENREFFMTLKSYFNNYADAKDFTKNLSYKKKSLGKKRGNTRRTVDQILK